MKQPELIGPSVLQLTETPPNGCTLWRCFTVCEHLERARYLAHHAPLKDQRVGQIAGRYDAFILPRLSWKLEERGIGEKWFSAIHRAGKTAIYEMDDDLLSPSIVARIHETSWEDGRSDEQLEQERQDRIWTLQQCDGVTVSTQRLATIVRQFTDKPVIVVPNAIDLKWFREVIHATRRTIPGLTIGWAGGRRPDADVDLMAQAWGKIARRYPDVRFVVQGYQPEVIAEHVPEDRIVRIPWLPLQEYPSGLRQVDIACAPLSDTPFNRSKSPIKCFEAAVAGAVVVASPLLYGRVVDHGSSGFIAESAAEWEDALAELVERPALRSMMAKRLLKTVERDHALENELWRWPAAWLAIRNDHLQRTGREPYQTPAPPSPIWVPNTRALAR